MTKREIITMIGSFIGIAIISGIFILVSNNQNKGIGSVMQSGEYHATTTSQGRFPSSVVLQSGYGTLGSVIITGATTGIINLYDATTTDVTKRTGNTATSTLYIATLPASTAAGTYTFDTSFYTGLLVEIIGTTPTTTITYR